MVLEIHHQGKFKGRGRSKAYTDGTVCTIDGYDPDMMGWFELRYILKDNVGLVKDYRVYQKKPNEPYSIVSTDTDVVNIFASETKDVCAKIFIEHLQPGEEKEELLPDYCKEDVVEEKGASVEVGSSKDANVVEGDSEDEESNDEESSDEEYQTPNASKLEELRGDTIRAIDESMSHLKKGKGAMLDKHELSDSDKVKFSDSDEDSDSDTNWYPRDEDLAEYEEDMEQQQQHEEQQQQKQLEQQQQKQLEQQQQKQHKQQQQKQHEQQQHEEQQQQKQHDEQQHEQQQQHEEQQQQQQQQNEYEQQQQHEGDDSDEAHESFELQFARTSMNKRKKKNTKGENEEDKILCGDECDPKDQCLSEYSDSDELHSIHESGDDEVSSKGPSFNERIGVENTRMVVGMSFESPAQFREYVRSYALVKGYEIRWAKNEGSRLIAVCSEKEVECPFRVYASWDSKKENFLIKSLRDEHSCIRNRTNRCVSSRWLAKRFLEHFRDDMKMSMETFKKVVVRELSIDIKNGLAYKARRIALDHLEGSYMQEYARLRDYGEALLKTNPGSRVIIKTEPMPTGDANMFVAMFVCFKPMIDGMMKGCRQIIGLDGTHLKTIIGGVLLTAVSRDPNNQMFPIAYGVVQVESKETWTWFITNLLEAIGVENLRGWTFLSDRQKGLVETFKKEVPAADIRFCVRHLYANFSKLYRGESLKRLLWGAATSWTKKGFEQNMQALKKANLEAYKYLHDISPQLWSRSHFDHTTKCDLLCNNICESFNKYILDTRDKSIVTMLEMIRRRIMIRFQEKKENASKWKGIVCPRIKEKLRKAVSKSRFCTIHYAGSGEFEVLESGHTYTVNTETRSCDCMEWNLSGIPCRHAVVCLIHLRAELEKYCDRWYHISEYLKVYEGMIHPIPDSSLWDKVECSQICPPKYKRQAGRPPKKARKRGVDEPKNPNAIRRIGGTIRCSKCKQEGHNSRGCKLTTQAPPPTPKEKSGNKGGRPRKEREFLSPGAETPTKKRKYNKHSATRVQVEVGGGSSNIGGGVNEAQGAQVHCEVGGGVDNINGSGVSQSQVSDADINRVFEQTMEQLNTSLDKMTTASSGGSFLNVGADRSSGGSLLNVGAASSSPTKMRYKQVVSRPASSSPTKNRYKQVVSRPRYSLSPSYQGGVPLTQQSQTTMQQSQTTQQQSQTTQQDTHGDQE